MKRPVKILVWAATALLAAGCSPAKITAHFPSASATPPPSLATRTPFQPTPQPTQATQTSLPTPAATPTRSPASSPTASLATPMPLPSPTVSHAGQTPRNLGSTVLAGGLPGPDDLYLAPDGSIYVSDITAGTVSRFGADGKLVAIVGGLSSPEGLVQLPDGTLVIAEQGRNRLVRFDPSSKQVTTFLSLSNPKNLLGVDGIALDTSQPGPATIVIPDSPNSALLRASQDGKQVTTIATGFDRPTGAWVEPDGGILVTDENAGQLVRLRPDGSRTVLSREALADDVVEDSAGNIFVISISEGTVHWIQSTTGQDTVLVRGLASPQGLCFDLSGNLVVAESGSHRVVRIQIWP